MNARMAQELNALRARFGMNQTELGKIIGVTQTQMSQRLKGNIPFDLNEIESFAEFFGLTPLQLLGYAEAPGPGGPGARSERPGRESNSRPFAYKVRLASLSAAA